MKCWTAAKGCVCKDRDRQYGSPEDSFGLIANYWRTYKGVYFDAHDVAMMMALLKLARIQGKRGKEDSYIDLAGYAACACELAEDDNE